jgi:uncharacterized RDD family membrane protein YckC
LRATALRAIIAVYVASSFVWFSWFNHESVGYFAETHGATAHIQAGTSPSAVALSLLGLVLFCISMGNEVKFESSRVAPLWRRFAAFLVDFWISLFVLSGIDVVPLLVEAHRTGTFRWHFERNYSVFSDAIGFSLVVVFLAAMFMYFAWPLARGRQTPGCFILRIATVMRGENPRRLSLSTALGRTFTEFRGLCSPWRTIGERDSQGRTWYDRETGFTVVTY